MSPSHSPAEPSQPSLPQLRTAAYRNQLAWVRRIGALDAFGKPHDWYDIDDLLAVRTGWTGAIMLPDPPDNAPEALPDAFTWLRLNGSGDVLIWAATPHCEIDRWLSAHGARESFTPLWMTRRLDLPLPAPPETSIATVRPAQADDLSLLLRQVDMPYFSQWQAHATIRLSTSAEAHPGIQLFVAVVDGEIVGRAVMSLTTTSIGITAGFYDVGVMPQWQRRGIGRQLTHALLVAAQQQGADFATLNATPAGEGIYVDMGFNEVGEGQTWLLPARTLQHQPDDELVRFAMMISGGSDLGSLKHLAWRELPNGDTPLAHAARFEQPKAARQLVAMGTIPDVAALWQLGLKDQARKQMRYLDELHTLRGAQQVTPLHIAIHWHDQELVEALLDAGADPNVRDGTFDCDAWGWCHILDNHEALAALRERFTEP